MFVMKDILPDEMYKHFLLLAVGSRILDSRILFHKYAEQAQEYLKAFATALTEIYGQDALVLNMHCLMHLADDVKTFNCPMTDVSAFAFESRLGKLKKYLRSGKNPLKQLCNRLQEEYALCKNNVRDVKVCNIIKYSKKKKEDGAIQIKKIRYNDCELTIKAPNNIVQLVDRSVLKINGMYSNAMTSNPTKIYLSGHVMDTDSAFEYPSNSRSLNIFKVKLNKTKNVRQVQLNNVCCKMAHLNIVEIAEDIGESYVIPILHMN